ncbi:MAG: aldo/keto reductase [Chloroflexi bacterium HGW-Chloroflexi-5]|jgi:hypothetical protein|nr:MAG: aldo/keto reductase [Chloroflexi bacterium HGW-Chloroflexi-5]
MQYRQFGKLDWKVSALGFGAMRLPILDGKTSNIDQAKATEMIRYAIDNGVNYFDTAYVYHDQKSEGAVGLALKDGYRERIKIATKLPIWLVKTTADFDRLLNEQLERLQTDHIDFYLLHALNKGSWQKILDLGLIQEAEKALADGRIHHLGFSFHDKLDTFKQIVDGYDKWTFCQIQYNFMDTEFQAGKEGLQYAATKGLAVVIMEPLRGGKLAADIPAARPLWESAPIQRKPADWALQWLWNQPEVAVVLSGMSTLDQLKENVESAAISSIGLLSAQELDLVEKVNKELTARSPIPCTSCEYCLPCPHGVNIPRNFESYNNAAMYNDVNDSRMDYKMWISDPEKASECIQCDECLDKCPQQIAISTWMPVIDSVLGQGQPFVEKVA